MNTYSVTEKGLVRANNQDAYLNYFSPQWALFVVCDGMGGHRAGDQASKLASISIRDFFIREKDRTDYEALLREGVEAANKAVYEKSQTAEAYYNMGTTLVACLVVKGVAYIAHVGDSRLYLWRRGALQQVTEDHSLVQKLVKQGLITPEEAKNHPDRSTLTRAVGTEPGLEVESDQCVLEEGDRILLCSDGLTTMLTDAEIKAAMEESDRAREACETLVQRALDRGGLDNITITLFEYRSQSWTKFY